MSTPVLIANGLFAPTRRGMSLLDRIASEQKKCSHPTRDPRGRCYRCGQLDANRDRAPEELTTKGGTND